MNSESYSPPSRIHAHGHDEVVGRLLNGDARLPHFAWQTSERLVDAVLHVDGGDVLIARDVERHGDLADAAVRAGRGHVEHALDAVDGLLERRGDRRFNRLGVRARVDGDHTDTVGGATSGYWAIGMTGSPARRRARSPASRRVARIGRRMKVSTNTDCRLWTGLGVL